MKPVDILVWVANPEALDKKLQTLPGAVARVVGVGTPEGPLLVDGFYVVRAFANADFVEFAMSHQGYAKVAGRCALDGDAA